MRMIDPEVWKLDLLLFHGCNEKTAWLIDRINHAPTIDAVPVIRCKNCCCWDEHEPNLDLTDLDESVIEEIKGRRHCWLFQGALMGPNDYCSCAKRKKQ